MAVLLTDFLQSLKMLISSYCEIMSSCCALLVVISRRNAHSKDADITVCGMVEGMDHKEYCTFFVIAIPLSVSAIYPLQGKSFSQSER